MIGLIIIIALNLFSILTTLLTSELFKKTIYEKHQIYRGNIKRHLPWRHILLICTFIGTIGFSVWQYRETTNQQEQEKKQVNSNQNRRDSIAASEKAKSDSVAKIVIQKSKNETIEALAKWGLKIDSANNRIRRILDTTKRVINVSNGPDPDFGICSIDTGIVLREVIGSRYRLRINICNNLAASKKINVKIYAVGKDNFEDFFYINSLNLLAANDEMPANSSLSSSISVYAGHPVKIIYFFVKGTFINSDESKTIRIDALYHYNIESKTFGGVMEENATQVRKILHQKGVL